MSKIRAIVTDLGGVLLRTEDRNPRTALASRYGMTYEELDSLVFNSPTGHSSQEGSVPDEEHWKFLMKTLHISAGDIPGFFDDFFAGDSLDKDFLNFIHSFHGQYKLGLLSNAWKMSAEILRESMRIHEGFDVAIFSAEVGLMKPDPAIYRLMEKELCVTSDQILFLDDNPINLEGASKVGWRVVQYISVEQARQSILEELGDR